MSVSPAIRLRRDVADCVLGGATYFDWRGPCPDDRLTLWECLDPANLITLRAAGVLEAAVLHAFTRHEGSAMAPHALRVLLDSCDRRRLRALTDPLPPGPHVVYRGTAGGPADGLSWSTSIATARFFALRPARADVKRQVWRTTLRDGQVYCHFSTTITLAFEFLADVAGARLEVVEEGEQIAANFHRDGLDAQLRSFVEHARRPTPSPESAAILRHLAGLLAPSFGAAEHDKVRR